MIWYISILSILIWSLLRSFQTLYGNVRVAQRIGLPYAIFPISGKGFLVPALLNTKWARYVVDGYLPAWLADAFNDNTNDKRWLTKNRRFERLGPVYLVVNPDAVACHVGDAAVAAYVFNARQDFPKPTWMYGGW